MKINLIVTVVTVLLMCPSLANAGFVKNLNLKEAQIHFEAAQGFESQGDYVSARDHYLKAHNAAVLAKAEPSLLSMLAYNYGRMAGVTCDYEQAQKVLTEALEIEAKVTGPQSGISSMRLFELARLNADNGHYDQSLAYYSKAIPIVENLKIEESDPAGYAVVLDQYAQVLDQNKEPAQAQKIRAKAQGLRTKYPDQKAQFAPLSYKCENGAPLKK
jgi:tetratricopeptide (TPR) repeat protein